MLIPVAVSSPLRKNIPLPFFGNVWFAPGHPASMQRGVSRSSRHARRGCSGRIGDAHDSFVRTNGVDADAKACGPGTPTLVSSSRG